MKQCRNKLATLGCAKNRRCESSRVTSPLEQQSVLTFKVVTLYMIVGSSHKFGSKTDYFLEHSILLRKLTLLEAILTGYLQA